MRPHDPYPAVFSEVIAVEMAKGMCIPARILMKAAEGWTDQQSSAALFLLEEKSSLPAKAEKRVLCLEVIIHIQEHRMVE
jgi:hypothetical protein